MGNRVEDLSGVFFVFMIGGLENTYNKTQTLHYAIKYKSVHSIVLFHCVGIALECTILCSAASVLLYV